MPLPLTQPSLKGTLVPQPDPSLGQYYDLVIRVRDLIKEHGRATLTVPYDQATGDPAFTYTIGLRLHEAHRGYELVTLGLPQNLAKPVLDRTVERLATEHLTPADGLVLPAIANTYPVQLHRVSDCSLFINGMRTLATATDPGVFTSALGLRRGKRFEGRFPSGV